VRAQNAKKVTLAGEWPDGLITEGNHSWPVWRYLAEFAPRHFVEKP
jgi:hypothetical protein